MDVGIPIELQADEHRVGLTPPGVSLLRQAGHRCYVQRGAGAGAGFPDADYERAGARIVYASEEVYARAELVLKVGAPTAAELAFLREGQTICAFWHLAARPREVIQTLADRRVTAVAYESIRHEDGERPVLRPLAEIAGLMAPQVAARWLQNDGGGRGVLISGLPGIPPVNVCILGGGVVGMAAARAFLAAGARVFLLDRDLAVLQRIDREFDGRVSTMVSYDFNVARAIRFAHVLIGAVNVTGHRAPVLVTREMVRTMRPRSVAIDIAVDQGGCIETTRPTTHADPVFVEEGVIHYCVPNMPGVVGRTATHAYLNAAWPTIQLLADLGTAAAIDADPALRRGVAIHDGAVRDEGLAMLLEEA